MPKKANSVDQLVGIRVRLRRRELGLSQERLADRLGITFQQVQKYENGTNRVGASRLQAIATALDVPIGYFFPAPDSAGAKQDHEAVDLLSAQGAVDLLRAYHQIGEPRLQRALLNLAKDLARSSVDPKGRIEIVAHPH